MPRNAAQKLIESHLVAGNADALCESGLQIDQTLTQDATGTLVMLAFEEEQPVTIANRTRDERYEAERGLSDRQASLVLAGSLISVVRVRQKNQTHAAG